MKRPLLCVAWVLSAVTLEAQSISITKPAAKDVVSGFSGYLFQSSLTSGPSVVEVCYTVDAYAAYNPGIDAPTTLGCAISPPFSYPYNTYWNINGPHQVVATGYNALGAVVATSAAVPFTTANAIQTTSVTPSMTVSTSIAVSSNWSGAPTITATFSGTGADALNFFAFIDGVLQSTAKGITGGTATLTVYTTLFQNGPHNVCVEIQGLTTYPNYTGDVANTIQALGGGAAEWCRTVTFANCATPSQALLNAHEVYLAPGGTFTLTAQLLNTDGTTTGSTPVSQSQTPCSASTILDPFRSRHSAIF